MKYAVKSAPPPGGDPNEFVMSDQGVDRMGDVIEAEGWQLKNFKSHPIALFNHDANQVIGKWSDVRVDGRQLRGRLELAEPGTSPLVDTVRALVDQGILRAVSVGFKPIDKKPLNKDADEWFGPFRFMKSELLECSLVAVPANPRALSTAKSLALASDMLAEVFCKNAGASAALHAKPGTRLLPTGNPMKPLSERIQDAQKELVTLRDEVTEITNAAEQPDEAQQTRIFELEALIEAKQKQLDAMLAAERSAAARTAAPAITGQRQIVVAHQQKIEPREHIVRAMAVHVISKIMNRPAEDVLRERYPGDEGTGVVLRAANAPAMTTVAGWAAELVNIVVADFLNQLPILAIYPKLALKGPRYTFGNNGVIKVPARNATPTINGSFVGEGQPIPVRKLGVSAITLTPKKMGVISEFTREMGAYSTPAIEGVIRQAINEDTAVAIDTVLIDTNPADTIRPAGLRNGIAGLVPSAAATRIDKIIADIQTLMAPIIAARGGRDLVLICNPAQKLAMDWAITPNGQFVFASNEVPAMRGITIVSSTTVPVTMLILIDAADFSSVTGDSPQFDVSDVATIHEEDTTPLPIVGGTVQPPVLGSVAAPVRSLWQTASIGVRMLLDMNWAMRRVNMVTWMTGVTW
jgi:HK97 family phage prohead protease/HK97 family phage major capsid protein